MVLHGSEPDNASLSVPWLEPVAQDWDRASTDVAVDLWVQNVDLVCLCW
jgi:hypothetical protein